ncbi:DUF4097 domain-containing protein [Priestia megaterium]|nr:DUF4097 domain-containing protein [Priestia megaterium]
MKKLLFVVVILIGAFFLLSTAYTSSAWTFNSAKSKVEVTDKIDSINMNISSAETVIVTENRNNVKADLKGNGKVSVKKSSDTIDVEYKRKPLSFFSFGRDAKLTIYIPENYNREMELSIGSGDVKFSGQSLALEHFTLKVGSGDVQLNDITAETFNSNVSSGDVQINKVTTKEGIFDIGSGEIDVNNFQGKLDAEVSSGDLYIQIAKLKDSINADVSSGDLTLELPQNADFTLKGNVSSGEINNQFKLKNYTHVQNKVEGTHGAGTHAIDLNVSSGDIELR